jgi:hypothetical protein
MTDRNKLKDRARDELFSHINRCGVLQAEGEDQEHWMKETMDYLAERYPDLTETDLKELFTVGLRFCSPAIPHGRKGSADADADAGTEDAGPDDHGSVEEEQGETVAAGAQEVGGA